MVKDNFELFQIKKPVYINKNRTEQFTVLQFLYKLFKVNKGNHINGEFFFDLKFKKSIMLRFFTSFLK